MNERVNRIIRKSKADLRRLKSRIKRASLEIFFTDKILNSLQRRKRVEIRVNYKKGENKKERRQGHIKDALALGGDEGRDKLR